MRCVYCHHTFEYTESVGSVCPQCGLPLQDAFEDPPAPAAPGGHRPAGSFSIRGGPSAVLSFAPFATAAVVSLVFGLLAGRLLGEGLVRGGAREAARPATALYPVPRTAPLVYVASNPAPDEPLPPEIAALLAPQPPVPAAPEPPGRPKLRPLPVVASAPVLLPPPHRLAGDPLRAPEPQRVTAILLGPAIGGVSGTWDMGSY